MEVFRELAERDLKITAVEDDEIRLKCTGKIEDKNPAGYLDPFFDEILLRAEATGKEINLDLSGVEYMNSAAVTPLVRLLEKVEAHDRLRVTLNFDARKLWQEIIVQAISVFESDKVSIGRV